MPGLTTHCLIIFSCFAFSYGRQTFDMQLDSFKLEQIKACFAKNETIRFNYITSTIDKIECIADGSGSYDAIMSLSDDEPCFNTISSNTTNNATCSCPCVAATTIAGIEGFLLLILIILLLVRIYCTGRSRVHNKDNPPPVPTSLPPSTYVHNGTQHHIAVAEGRLDNHSNARSTQDNSDSHEREVVRLPRRISTVKFGKLLKRAWGSRPQGGNSEDDNPPQVPPKDHSYKMYPKSVDTPSLASGTLQGRVSSTASYNETQFTTSKPYEEATYADADEGLPSEPRPIQLAIQPQPVQSVSYTPSSPPTPPKPTVLPKSYWKPNTPTASVNSNLNLSKKRAPDPSNDSNYYDVSPDPQAGTGDATDDHQTYYDVVNDGR